MLYVYSVAFADGAQQLGLGSAINVLTIMLILIMLIPFIREPSRKRRPHDDRSTAAGTVHVGPAMGAAGDIDAPRRRRRDGAAGRRLVLTGLFLRGSSACSC